MMEKLLLNNVRLEGVQDPQSIYIAQGVIQSVTPQPPAADSQTRLLDCGGRLAVPGLINFHTHLDKAGLAEVIPNRSGTIGEARSLLLQYKQTMGKADIKRRAREAIRRSVLAGVTAIRTHVDVDPSIGLRGIEALLELKEELRDVITLQIVAFPQEGISEAPGTEALMRSALELGADVVGGHLSIAADFAEHAARVFDLAEAYGREVDIHVDYDIDRDYSQVSRHPDGLEYPDALGIMAMCEETLRRGFPRNVTASHLCGLDSVEPVYAQRIIALIRRAGVGVVALAPNNMYCNGRGDPCNTRRGVTKAKALMAAGVPVYFGPDNLRDPFNPLGCEDMLVNALLTAYACHFATTEDYAALLRMCTCDAAARMGLEGYGIQPGCRADIAVLDAPSFHQALCQTAKPTALVRDGRLLFWREAELHWQADAAALLGQAQR